MSKSIYISFLIQPFLDSITGLSVGVPALDIDRVNRINAVIRREIGWIVSDNLIHKVCKILNVPKRRCI